jgi:SNF2 family DNA or RNA helicase
MKSLDESATAYEYQIEGVDFILRTANGSALIGDAMGLGKTIQSILALREGDGYLPSLIVVKSATMPNWMREINKWLDASLTAYFPIIGTQPFIPPGFSTYIISQDSLSLNQTQLQGLHLFQPFKSIIVDECHGFKEESSKRTKALFKFLSPSYESSTGVKIPVKDPIKKRIFLSGTPIKNRADEYFTTLNLLRPNDSNFKLKQRFRYNFLRQNDKGVWASIHPRRLDAFKDATKDFVLRREKTDVLTKLPSFTRNYEFVKVESDAIKHVYNHELDLMTNALKQKSMDSLCLLGWLAHMRHITGIAKVPAALEYAKEFLEDGEVAKLIDPNYPNKLAIGIHHKGVRISLMDALAPYNPLSLSGDDDPFEKQKIVDKFSDAKHPFLILNMLAGGVGLNIQSCANTLVLERQWNSADEEQFESRFHRNGQTYPVIATYMIADGTIDHFFHDMVEEKRRIFGSTVAFNLSSDTEGIKSLVQRTLGNRL